VGQAINLVSLLMTLATTLILLRPFTVKRRASALRNTVQIAVYHDQLQELDREMSVGLMDPEQAEMVRAELGRRIIKEVKASTIDVASPTSSRSPYLVFIIVVLTVAYLTNAVESTPELLFGARARETPQTGIELNSGMMAIRERLRSNPQSDNSWRDLTALYLEEGRYVDAERELRSGIIRYGANAERLDDLGQVLIDQNEGLVSGESLALFKQAKQILPYDIRANFFIALSLEQSGRDAEAKSAFEAIAGRLPADAPELPVVLRHISETAAKQIERLD